MRIRSSAILYIVFGLFMLIFPGIINNSFGYVVGSMSLLFGISQLLAYRGSASSLRNGNLVFGIIGVVFGIYLFLNPKFVSAIIPIVVGIVIILAGISKLNTVINTKSYSNKYGKSSLLVSIILLVAGAILLFNPVGSVELLIRIVGIILIINGIYDMYISNYISTAIVKPTKKDKKVIKTINVD